MTKLEKFKRDMAAFRQLSPAQKQGYWKARLSAMSHEEVAELYKRIFEDLDQ